MTLDRKLNVRCTWCGKKNTLGEWNDLTYSKCTSREMRRAFMPLTDSSVFKDNTKAYYICPSCNMWNKGNQLKITDTDDENLKKLGGRLGLKFSGK